MSEHPKDGQSPEQFIRDNAWIFVPTNSLKPEGRAARRRAAEGFEARWEGKPVTARRCHVIIDIRQGKNAPRIPAIIVSPDDGSRPFCIDNTMGIGELKVFLVDGSAAFSHRVIHPTHILATEDEPQIDLAGLKAILDKVESGQLPTVAIPGLFSAFLPKAQG